MSDEYDFSQIAQLISELHVRKNERCEWICSHTSMRNLGERFDDVDDLRQQVNEATKGETE